MNQRTRIDYLYSSPADSVDELSIDKQASLERSLVYKVFINCNL
jgi:hypothetical protein